MFGPNNNMFQYSTHYSKTFCIEPKYVDSDSSWGESHTEIQFRNGQIYMGDCIGKFSIINYDYDDRMIRRSKNSCSQ